MAAVDAGSDEDRPPRARTASPDFPLWHGVLGFPFQVESIKPWALIAISTTMLALIAISFHALISILPEDISNGFAMLIYRGSWHVFTGLVLISILLSFYPAACFLAIVQDSAAGADEVNWPSDLWFEYVWRLLYLVWLAACSLALAALLLAVLAPFVGKLTWWSCALGLAAALFPIVMLSTLVGGAPYVVLHHEVLFRLLRQPVTAFTLYVYTALLVGPSVALGVWMVSGLIWWLAPWVGLLWATSWLIHARVLGRVGWLLDGGGQPRPRKRKKRKTRPSAEPEE